MSLPPVPAFPDIEDVLVTLISTWWPGRVDSERPENLKALLAGDGFFIEVQRYAGADDGLTDHAAVEASVYAATHTVGVRAAEQLRARLLHAPHVLGLPPQVRAIDRVSTLLGPAEVPYGDSGVRRWTARYRLSCRKGA